MNSFLHHLDQLVKQNQEKSPSYSKDHWHVAGRKSKDHPNGNDEAYWREHGPAMVESYAAWRDETNWPLWYPNGKPAIELECNFQLPGDVRIKAFIDRVFVLPNGDLCVTDIKTGARVPDHTMQLGVYACGVQALFGVRPRWGNFWMGRKGTHTQPTPLDKWTPEVLGEVFTEFIRGVEAGAFAPKPSNMCSSCSVADHCFIQDGPYAYLSDPLAQLADTSDVPF